MYTAVRIVKMKACSIATKPSMIMMKAAKPTAGKSPGKGGAE